MRQNPIGNIDKQLIEFLYIGIFVLLIVSLTQVAMRLHDINKSGWLSLLVLVPIVNIAGIALFFLKGDVGSNKYGEDPKRSITNEKEMENSAKKVKSNIDKIQELNWIDFKPKFILLKKAFESGVFTQSEYNIKKIELEKERENVKTELKNLEEKAKMEEALKEQKEKLIDQKKRLTELIKEGLLTEHEYHQKMIAINETLNKLDL